MLGDSPYFVLLAIGFAVAFAWASRAASRLDIPRLALTDVCIAALVGGIVGSRALHVAVEPLPGDALGPHAIEEVRADANLLDPPGRAAVLAALERPPVPAPWAFIARMPPGSARDAALEAVVRDPHDVPARLWYRACPLEALMFWKGGLAYLGGLVLASGLALLMTRRHGVPLGRMSDLAAPAIALGLVFGRLGCFIGGCCYGAVCEPAWWSSPPPWYPAGEHARYPTALSLAAYDLLLFVVLRRALFRPHASWQVWLAFLALYAPGRMAVEALRGDPRGGAFGLSTSQWLALVTAIPAAISWVALERRRAVAAEPVLPGPPPAAG